MQQKELERQSGKSARSAPLTCSDVRNRLCKRSTHFIKVNLTQLQRNKRKQADKTSGQKCPRVCDVDVIPAADADDDVTTQLVTAVTGTPATTSSPQLPHPELEELPPAAVQPAVVGNANHDACTICNQVDPPPHKCRRVINIQWVRPCLKHAGTTPVQYNRQRCRQRRQGSRDTVLSETVLQ